MFPGSHVDRNHARRYNKNRKAAIDKERNGCYEQGCTVLDRNGTIRH